MGLILRADKAADKNSKSPHHPGLELIDFNLASRRDRTGYMLITNPVEYRPCRAMQ
jgi:hypothetical protein